MSDPIADRLAAARSSAAGTPQVEGDLIRPVNWLLAGVALMAAAIAGLQRAILWQYSAGRDWVFWDELRRWRRRSFCDD
jgi:hypothetical protein